MTAYVRTRLLDQAYPNFADDLVARLDAVQADSGPSPTQFAASVGLTTQALRHTRRMAGRSMPALGSIASICVARDVSPTWLLFGAGPKGLAEASSACPVCVPRLELAS